MKEILTEDEKKLVQDLKRGDIGAFDQLFCHYSTPLYRFAYGYLRSKEEAEDVVQEVFIKVWEKRLMLVPELSFSSFLFTLAYRSTLNVLRKRKNGWKAVAIHAERKLQYTQHVEEELMANELERHTQLAIEALPAQRKRIFLMSRQEHLSGDEIARQLNLSPKTVEGQISSSIKFLRRYFTRIGIH